MLVLYKKWKKYNQIQLTKNKMDLNIRKMTNHPPSPGSKSCCTRSGYVNQQNITQQKKITQHRNPKDYTVNIKIYK